MPISAAELLRSVGLTVDGPVRWGAPVREQRPGLYVVEWSQALDRAPVDISAIGTWLQRVPGLLVDGARPTGKGLAARLSAWWLPGETVVFVGGSARPIGKRVEAFATTPLGAARPHSAGQWLKALAGLDRALVWWAPTAAAEEYEDACLEAFAAAVTPETRAALPDRSIVLPFANRRRPDGTARNDGVTGSTAELEGPVAGPGPATAPRRTAATLSDVEIERLNGMLQALACAEPGLEITPAQANREGAVRRMLGEDPSRPPAALSQLLRAGRIEGAHQDLDGRWSIRCIRRG